MARRKREEEPENHERWLVSYADFITLLFAFFVVMYSISAVNEGKYRVLSDSLSSTFSNDSNPPSGPDHIQIGEVTAGDAMDLLNEGVSLADLPFDMEVPEEELETDVEPEDEVDEVAEAEAKAELQAEEALSELSEEVEKAMSPFIDQNLVDVKKNKYWLEIEMKSRLLFTSGKARLSRQALQPLQQIAKILQPMKNPVFIEGYTDDIPIKTLAFPSNWELSAARAASVVNLFGRLGIDSQRLAAIGYGEFRPIADNKTNDGRDKNRRVSIIVMADSKNKRPLEVYQKGKVAPTKVTQ
ncbi:MAG: flagellar motor protein MotD [Methylococcales bacterium]|jgi:chemotaxis protein MotB|nr:flagellar motor protein MotD [Methylococcales bacterium]MBT7444997.1 flagellar motor protein MotD [Methylococcales bacterium]